MGQQSVLLSVLLAALVLATSSAHRKSFQYEHQSRGDLAQTETNWRKPLVHRVQPTSSHVYRLGLLPPSHAQENPSVHELQGGCGDESVLVQSKKTGEVQVINQKRFRRDAENVREKRGYIHWHGFGVSQYNPPIQSIQFHSIPSIHRPTSVANQWHSRYQQRYQIIMPIWSNSHPIYVYLPHNTGYKIANQPCQQVQPIPTPQPTTEAPDVESTSTPPEIVTIENRFSHLNSLTDDQNEESSLKTTTHTPPAVQATKPPTPPLFHRPSGGTGSQGNSQPTTKAPDAISEEVLKEKPRFGDNLTDDQDAPVWDK